MPDVGDRGLATTIDDVTNTLLAIAAALAAAFFLALAAALQQRAAEASPQRWTVHPRLMLHLLRQPLWIIGIVTGMVGVGFQVAALRWGPLALVQPVGVTTLLFALPVGAALRGRRVTRRDVYAAVVVAGGLGGLLATLNPSTGTPTLDVDRFGVLAVLVAGGLAATVLLALRCHGALRTVLLATGAGAAFGSTAALVQLLLHRAAEQGVMAAVGWLTLATVGVSWTGLLLSQAAYKGGQLPTALATILVIDPLVAIGVGAFALGEPVSTAAPLLVAAEALLVVGGVLCLARSSHDGGAEVPAASAGPVSSAGPAGSAGSASSGVPLVPDMSGHRILIGTDTYPPDVNGASHFTYRLACGLAARGHDVHVVCPSTSQRFTHDVRDGVTIHRLPSRGVPFHPSFRVCPAPGAAVARVLATVRPTVVHVQGHFLIGRALSAHARRAGVPVIATNHFMPENLLPYTSVPPWLEPPLASAAWRDCLRVFRRAYAVTAPTPIAAELVRTKGFRQPVTPISCGIDLARFAPYEGRRDPGILGLPDRPTLLFVGRLDGEKRIHDLIDALPAVRQHVDAQLALVGVGTRRGELEALARERNVAEHVHFLGFVPEEQLPLVYTIADVFCMPGVAELQSLVTLEAMASVRPVVAADAMALPHLVWNGHNGFRYEPGHTRTLAGHLISLLSDPQLRRSMGAASRTIAAEHDVTRSLERFEELYDEATGRLSQGVEVGEVEAGGDYTADQHLVLARR